MNADEFLPLREEEVTDVRVARRLINYSSLVEEIVGRLVADGIADTKGVRATHGYTYSGRYVRLRSRFGLWLGVDLEAWRGRGVTPVWSVHDTKDSFSGVEGKILQVVNVFDDAQEGDDNEVYVPIRLTTGVDRDRVVDDAARQMRSIADRLLQEFPEG